MLKNKFYVFCAIAISVLLALTICVDVAFPLKHYKIVKKYCSAFGVRPSLALAVIWTESKNDEFAISNAGACGLMQLMPSTAKWLCAITGQVYDYDKLFDAEYNVRLGIYYISYLQQKFSGNYVLAAYNAGEGNVRRWLSDGGEIKYDETRDYVKRVNALTKIYAFRIGDVT